MKLESEKSEPLIKADISGAAVLGISLAFGFMTQQANTTKIFSLIQEGNWFRNTGALLLMRIFLIACFLFIPFQRRLFAIAGLFLIVSWTALYSVVGAFILPLATSCAFFYFADDQPKLQRRQGATLMLALPFLLSAIQKMNGGYLSGSEFSPSGSFLAFLYTWGLPHDFIPDSLRSFLPISSIIVEFAIFIGLFLRPIWFAHITLLFATLLAFIHPPVIFVYGFFLPFALLIDEEWREKLNQTRAAIALQQPFFWCAATIFSFIRSTDFTVSGLKVWPVAFLLAIYHVRLLISHRAIKLPAFDFLNLMKARWQLIAPAFVVCTFLASLAGAPAPVGFSMFSGRPLGSDTHSMHVSNRDLCQKIYAQWVFSLVVDAGIVRNQDGSCVARFPTVSGLQGMKEALCQLSPLAAWSTKNRSSEMWAPENCGQPRSHVE